MLQNWLNTESLDEFFSKYWLKEFRKIYQNPNIKIPFSVADMDELLMKERVIYPQVKILGENGLIDPYFYTKTSSSSFQPNLDLNKLRSLNFSKKTIIINNLQKVHDGIRCFQRHLSDAFGCEVNINAYYTKGPVQGLKPHYDLHHVFAVQLEGEKNWSLGPIVVDTPHDEFHPYDFTEPEFTNFVSLKQGEFLYMPPGLWHTVYTESLSLHLTVGIHPPDWLSKIRQNINSTMCKHSILRAQLPFQVHGDRCEYKKDIEKDMGQLFDLIKQETLAEQKENSVQKVRDAQLKSKMLPSFTFEHECTSLFPDLNSALNDIWHQLDNPIALYVRGSMVASKKLQPWDFDIIAICEREMDMKSQYYIQNHFAKTYPLLPVLDLTCISSSQLESSKDYTLLKILLHEQGVLVNGNDIRNSLNKPKYNIETAKYIARTYSKQFDRILEAYLFNKKSFSNKEKTFYLKSLCKLCLRMVAPIVMAREGVFIRDIELCQQYIENLLKKQNTQTKLVIEFIKDSVVESELLIATCLMLKVKLEDALDSM
ncbi:JmjC domain-containing protein [Priestia megaterium]|uniref:JmjC domain-containing protein n=1 Tax=Priestia megaterium TaxID=1404 RepID=UPI0022B8AAF2|nr:cupin domain-containing protein [Priestia megaterium]MCZ8497381.1 hypothetical protein [Priestia megaterium]